MNDDSQFDVVDSLLELWVSHKKRTVMTRLFDNHGLYACGCKTNSTLWGLVKRSDFLLTSAIGGNFYATYWFEP